jgi:hypothetical protein
VGIFDSVASSVGSAWDSVKSVGQQGYDYFVDPNKWELEHFGSIGGLAQTPTEPTTSEFEAGPLGFAYNDAEAELEKPAGFPAEYNPMLEWEDKQILAKGGFLSSDEERMYGVQNWKHPARGGE